MWLAPLHSEAAIVYFSAEDWSRVGELGRALPVPQAAWEPVVETSAQKLAWVSLKPRGQSAAGACGA